MGIDLFKHFFFPHNSSKMEGEMERVPSKRTSVLGIILYFGLEIGG